MKIRLLLKNSILSAFAQITLIIIGFFSNRVINIVLGEAVIGLNGIVANIIGLLSVTELGFSTTITFHLYQIIAKNDTNAIAALMKFYKKVYFIIGTILAALGLIIMPFFHFAIKDNPFSTTYVRLVFLIWLMRTLVTYFLGYKKTLIIADQREYIISLLTIIGNILNNISIILIVIKTNNYVIALLSNLIIEVIILLINNAYADHRYPYLKNNSTTISSETKASLINDVKNIFITQVAGKGITSTDNIIISSIIGIAINGLYNNYMLINSSITNIMFSIGNAMQPTIGSIFTEKDYKKDYQILRQLSYIFFVFSSVIASCLLSLTQLFINDFWLNSKYLLNFNTVILFTIYTTLTTMGIPLIIVMAVTGMFDKDRNLNIVGASVNLAISIILSFVIGINGVILGTIVTLIVQTSMRCHYFFTYYIQRSFVHYLKDYFIYIILIIGESFITYVIIDRIYTHKSILLFIICIITSATLPLIANILIFIKTWRFNSLISIL